MSKRNNIYHVRKNIDYYCGRCDNDVQFNYVGWHKTIDRSIKYYFQCESCTTIYSNYTMEKIYKELMRDDLQESVLEKLIKKDG